MLSAFTPVLSMAVPKPAEASLIVTLDTDIVTDPAQRAQQSRVLVYAAPLPADLQKQILDTFARVVTKPLMSQPIRGLPQTAVAYHLFSALVTAGVRRRKSLIA